MASLGDITFDCRHAATLARFWAAALDGFEIAPYDDEEIERLRSMGIDDVEDDPNVLVIGPTPKPRLFFQTVPEAKVAKNRVHLDLEADDVEAEVARLVSLGATELARHGDFIVLADPGGNELCVTPTR